VAWIIFNNPIMGRTYWFECSRCGYRAKASGREDRGFGFFIQTIACRDCKSLYDAVIRMKTPVDPDSKIRNGSFGLQGFRPANRLRAPTSPPVFQSVLNRLTFRGVKKFEWVQFKPQCPVSASHRVEPWNDPDKCPRCATYMEKHPLPYRIWD
jgi:hypothetical protein